MAINSAEVKIKKSGVIALLTFFILFLLNACAPKEENPAPPDLIPQPEMTAIITDLSVSEAALTGEPLATFNDTLRKVNVLKEHHVTKDHFVKSFRYYTENPKILKEIYDSVVVRIAQKQQGK